LDLGLSAGGRGHGEPRREGGERREAFHLVLPID
jgi:hypothetical protein